MAKVNIPVCNLTDEDCATLFQSVIEKLNIHNPKFYYPIYNKIVDNASSQPGLVFDSKFKVKEILAKVIDSDSEEYDSEEEPESDNYKPVFNLAGNASNEIDIDCDEEGDNLEEVFYSKEEVNLDNLNVLNTMEGGSNEQNGDEEGWETDDDLEIDEAISNIFTATAKVERVNNTTGEKTVKEEKIHIKKSPLLEPLKILKDEYVIPARIKNKNLDDEVLHNTNAKIDSYNNSAHVEALFLYLGNKLVESGKCPSFPYYYGCINGEDPNYHHDITDEYDMVSRTRWFRQRIKTDFDLLILEGDEMDDAQREIDNNMRKPISHSRFGFERNRHSSGSWQESDSESDNGSNDGSNDASESDDIEQTLEFLDKDDIDSNNNTNDNINQDTTAIPLDNIDTTLENILANGDASSMKKGGFVEELDDADLELDDEIMLISSRNTTDCKEISKKIDLNVDDDLIEVLSDVDKENLTLSDFEDNSINNQYYLKCAQIPVNLCLMEKLDQTLDNLLDDGYNMSETEWFSVFFQTAFGLAIAQKYFNFVHNDLHSSNIMFKATELKHLFFQIGSQIYKVPTFGKITKIIDFARGTFKLGDRWVFSDQFKEEGDAWGQYDYPSDGTLKNCEHKPNPSFDLVRLGTTVIQRLDELPNIRHFVEEITKDDYENSLCYEDDTFQLYIDIAHNAHNAVPIEVLGRTEFERFLVAKERVPKGVYVFKY